MTYSICVRTIPQRLTLFVDLFERLMMIASHPSIDAVHVSNDVLITPNENGCRALEKTLNDKSDWVIFLEDDAELIHDFVDSTDRWLVDHQEPAVHIYPLGCQYSETWPKGTSVWRYELKDYYCSVALVIRKSFVPSFIEYVRKNSEITQGFDLMLSNWHKTISASSYLLTPIPCFIDHIGDDSTLANTRGNHDVVGRFRGFRGLDYSYPEAKRG